MDEKNLYKLLIYLGIFAIAILIIISEKPKAKAEKKEEDINTQESKENIFLENLSVDNYKLTLYYSMDDDGCTIIEEKNDNVIVGSKKYHKEVIDYVFYNDKYYSYSNEGFEIIVDFNNFDYDKTFIKLENIKKLLNINHSEIVKGDIVTLVFNIKDVLMLYNEINNSSYISLNDENVKLIYNKKENNIKLELTSLYNLINNKDYNNVVYNMKFESLDKEDMSFIKDKLD